MNKYNNVFLYQAHLIFKCYKYEFYISKKNFLFKFFILYIVWTRVNSMDEEICLVDSCTTNTILRKIKYFQTLTKREGNFLTIAGRDAMIVGSGRATIILPMGTQIVIEKALLYPDSTRTLLSYRDIRKNEFHVETHEESKEEYLLFTKDT